MIEFSALEWSDRDAGLGSARKAIVSRPEKFRMSERPEQHLRVSNARLNWSGVNLLRVESSGHDIELLDEEALTIMMPVCGELRVSAHGHDYRTSGAGNLTFLPSRRVTSVRGSDKQSFQSYLLKAPMQKDRYVAAAIGSMTTDGTKVKTSDPAAHALSNLVAYVMSIFEQGLHHSMPPKWGALIEHLVSEQLRSMAEASVAASAPALVPLKTVWTADEFMHANFDSPLRLEDIANAVGVSGRQLQTAYKTTTGETPWERLTAIRLMKARQLLLNAEPGQTVTQIAVACGLSHFGRFSSAYKRHFKELPSETLRKSRPKTGMPT
jgi:AraC-like DNA-binding protein